MKDVSGVKAGYLQIPYLIVWDKFIEYIDIRKNKFLCQGAVL